MLKRFKLKSILFSDSKKDREEKCMYRAESAILKIMKILYLGKSCPADISHWIDVLSGILREVSKKKVSPIRLFIGLVDNYKNLPRRIKEEEIEKLRSGKTVEGYIKDLTQLLLNQHTSEGNKYRQAYNAELQAGNIPSVDTFVRSVKYLALCIENNRFLDNYSIWDKEVEMTQVQWDDAYEVDRNFIEKVILKILNEI